MNICEHLTVTAKLFPDHEAIRFEGRSFTYAQLDRLSIDAAAQLTAASIEPGDRVGIMLPNVPAFVVWYYGALRIGAIAVSVSTRLAPAEVAFVVDDSGAKVFVADESTLANVQIELPTSVTRTFSTSDLGDECDGRPLAVDAAPPRCFAAEPDDPALILYTSGTTGFPKGATLSHLNVRSNVHAFNHLCNMQPHDRILLAVPLFHCFGQNALLNSAFNVGATLVLQRRFDLNEAKRLIADERVTQLYGVPMMFQLLFDSCQASDLPWVNYCFSAAATLPIQVSQRWQRKFGLPINEGYGLTETSPFAAYNHRLKFEPGSIGTPIDSVEMKIVDTETGRDCEPGALGEIAIRGPNVMLGYWNREQDTQSAIRNGWFHSGDIGRIDEQGYFYIVDRVKDMIAVGGLKVYPAEVERVLLDHPHVVQAAVVGIPDDVFGEQVVAFVVFKDADSLFAAQHLADIKQHAAEKLANYKVPRQVVNIDELPRNPSGKVLKTKLREYDLQTIVTDAGDAALEAASNVREPTLGKQLAATHAAGRGRVASAFVQELVRAVSGSDEVFDRRTRFLDAGLDSLMIVEMSHQIQVELGPQHVVPTTLVFDHPRICDLSEYLVTALSPEDSSHLTHTANVETNARELEHRIESMSEEEALAELMRELENRS